MKEIHVAIVGRVNVGKSTLFNRLLGKRISIVDKTPKITRDPVKGEVEIKGVTFVLWDTGGFIPEPKDDIEKAVNEKILERIKNSHLILFVVDARAGITGGDEEIARLLRPFSEKTILVVNKVDSRELEVTVNEFYSLGFSEVIGVSAQSGYNLAKLEDLLVEKSSKITVQDVEQEAPQADITVTIAGRPNVGKSTLLNALTGKQRAIVTDVPGTTRDPVMETAFTDGFVLNLVDTAGVRRRPRIRYGVEFFSVGRSLDFIEKSDAVIVVADATEGIVAQDIKLLSLALRKGKAVVMALNKWDAVKGNRHKELKVENSIALRMKPFPFVPIVKISAVKGWGLGKLILQLRKAVESWKMRVPTPKLNRVLREVLASTPPFTRRGKAVKVKYLTQVGTSPPHFVIFANTTDIPNSYLRFLKNVIREKFQFIGTEIFLDVRESR